MRRLFTPSMVLVVGLGIAAGCTTGAYEQAIEDFAFATEKADKAVEKMASQLEDRERERRIEVALKKPLAVRPADDTCQSGSEACRLVIKAGGGEDPLPLEPGPQLRNTRALIDEIESYAVLLDAIAKADHRSEVEGAIDGISGSVKKIAKLFGREAPAALSPAADLVGWIAGVYLDNLKLTALRDATRAAEQAFPETEAFLTTIATFLDEPQDVDYTLAFNEAQRKFRFEKNSRANLLAWNQSANLLDKALKLRTGDVFKKMREAHHELHRALAPPDLDFESAIAKINEYRKVVEELLEILEALETAVSGKEG